MKFPEAIEMVAKANEAAIQRIQDWMDSQNFAPEQREKWWENYRIKVNRAIEDFINQDSL